MFVVVNIGYSVGVLRVVPNGRHDGGGSGYNCKVRLFSEVVVDNSNNYSLIDDDCGGCCKGIRTISR